MTEACKSVDFVKFARHWNKRAEVKKRWDPSPARMQAQNQAWAKYACEPNQHTDMASAQAATQVMSKLNATSNAFIMGVGGSVSEAASSNSSYIYGNSSASGVSSGGELAQWECSMVGGGVNMVEIQDEC